MLSHFHLCLHLIRPPFSAWLALEAFHLNLAACSTVEYASHFVCSSCSCACPRPNTGPRPLSLVRLLCQLFQPKRTCVSPVNGSPSSKACAQMICHVVRPLVFPGLLQSANLSISRGHRDLVQPLLGSRGPKRQQAQHKSNDPLDSRAMHTLASSLRAREPLALTALHLGHWSGGGERGCSDLVLGTSNSTTELGGLHGETACDSVEECEGRVGGCDERGPEG